MLLGVVFSASQDAVYSLLHRLFDLAFTFELLRIVQCISPEPLLTMLASILVVMIMLAENITDSLQGHAASVLT